MIGKSEIWFGAGELAWKLTVMFFGQEKTIAFPSKREADGYLDFLHAWYGH